MSADGVWAYPRRHSVLQRMRTSEAQRQRHGRLDPMLLINMTAIPGVRHRLCQWIVHPGRRPPLMCGAPVIAPGCSWCDKHAEIVFQPREPVHG